LSPATRDRRASLRPKPVLTRASMWNKLLPSSEALRAPPARPNDWLHATTGVTSRMRRHSIRSMRNRAPLTSACCFLMACLSLGVAHAQGKFRLKGSLRSEAQHGQQQPLIPRVRPAGECARTAWMRKCVIRQRPHVGIYFLARPCTDPRHGVGGDDAPGE